MPILLSMLHMRHCMFSKHSNYLCISHQDNLSNTLLHSKLCQKRNSNIQLLILQSTLHRRHYKFSKRSNYLCIFH